MAIWTSSSSLRLLYRLYSSCPMARCLPRALISVAILFHLSPWPPEDTQRGGASIKSEKSVRRSKPPWSLRVLRGSYVYTQGRLCFLVAITQSFFIHSFCHTIHPTTHSSTHPSTRSSIHHSTSLSNYPSNQPPICPIIHRPTHPAVHPPTHLSIHPPICSLSHPSVQPSNHPSNIHAPIHPLICLANHPTIHPSLHYSPSDVSVYPPPIHLSIHPSIHLYIQPTIHSSTIHFSIPDSLSIHVCMHHSLRDYLLSTSSMSDTLLSTGDTTTTIPRDRIPALKEITQRCPHSFLPIIQQHPIHAFLCLVLELRLLEMNHLI